MTGDFEALDAAARVLTLEHCDRAASGEFEDPAILSAIVGVERLAEAIGSTDGTTLRATLESPPAGRVADLVDEVHRLVSDSLNRRAYGYRPDAAVLNEDAGMYDISYDVDLLRAAVRASVQSFREESYYLARYGARGTSFAASDSCWLVRLTDFDADYTHQQVMWLGGLLAGRGMPTWLMQLHLQHLVDQVEAIDRDAGVVPGVIERIREERSAFVDDATIEAARTRGVDAVDGVPHAGTLVAAAVADELGGMSRHDGGLWDWLTDPERCGDAGRATLEAIRSDARAT